MQKFYCVIIVLVAVFYAMPPTELVAADVLRVATFRCDVTPPLGQPMFACDVIRTVEQPLLAKGIVLESGSECYVLCVLDWCEVCGVSHQGLRSKIAAATKIDLGHIAVQTVHQHTAPLVDIGAQKLLAEIGAAHMHLDPNVLEEIEQRVVLAVQQVLDRFEPFDHVGTGQAKVDRVASSRRARDAEGKIHVRYSACQNADIRALPEGKIDPYVKTITLARGQKPLVRLHYYATHPQTRYGDGRASSDIVGDAREALERKENVFQIYFTGCAGDITLGKYNDGSNECRKELGDRLLAGMETAVEATQWAPASDIRWRTYSFLLPRRTDPGYTMNDCLERMKNTGLLAVDRYYKGAVRASFWQRDGQPIELSSLQIGKVQIVHLPGEPLIDFQLYAQGLKPDNFVAVAGYGDCGPGYICPEAAYSEGGYEPIDSCVKPESEMLLKRAISTLLGVP